MTIATKTKTRPAAGKVATEPHLPTLIGVGQIDPHPDNPRQEFPLAELDALAASLTDLEMLSPIQVEPGDVPGRYRLLSGERRWRAAKLAGWREVPAYVRRLTRDKAALLLAEDNLQHRELNPIETARAIALLVKPKADGGAGLTHAQIGRRFDKDPSWSVNLLRMLRLPPALQEETRAGALNTRQARALVAYVDSPDVLAAVAAGRAANPNDWKSSEQFEQQLKEVAQRVEAFGQRAASDLSQDTPTMSNRKSATPAAPAPAAPAVAKYTARQAAHRPATLTAPVSAALTVAQIVAAIGELTSLEDVHQITNAGHARAYQLHNKS